MTATPARAPLPAAPRARLDPDAARRSSRSGGRQCASADDLENGATGLILVFADSISANCFGLEPSAAALARVLDGIDLTAGIALDLNLSPSSRHIVGDLADLVKSKGVAPAAVDIRFSINPIGGFAACGTSPRRWPDWRLISPRWSAILPAPVSAGLLPSPTDASSIMPAARRRRSLLLRWRARSPICARSKQAA